MNWRAYRFPPLLATQAASSELPSGQDAAVDGFRQGMDMGYSEGFATGEQAGQDAGYQAGLAAGREAGRQEALAQIRAEFAEAARPLEAVTAAMERARVDYQAALRDDVINLVAKVAKQVIRCELTLKPAQILDLVEETLAALPPLSGEVEVLLNAEEYQRIKELAPERASRWALRADATLAQGECRIRSAESSIDAGCAQRLDACVDRLREQLAQDAHEADGGRSSKTAKATKTAKVAESTAQPEPAVVADAPAKTPRSRKPKPSVQAES